ARVAQRDLFDFASFFDDVEQAVGGGFAVSFGTVNRNRLSGDYFVRRMVDSHGVCIHDSSYGLRVGVNVRCGNILSGVDEWEDFANVTTHHALEFTLGHTFEVANDAALSTAK